MGTRNLTCVFMDGEYKVAQYGQWDGYPAGQGVTCLAFLKGMDEQTFREQLKRTRFMSTDETDEKWAEYAEEDGSMSLVNYERYSDQYPALSRDTAAEILSYIYNRKADDIPLVNNIEFAGDSLFCEWAYVIDLDKRTFEAYVGFNKNPLADGERFKELDERLQQEEPGEYHAVKLVKSYSLDDLPETDDDFISEVEELANEG